MKKILQFSIIIISIFNGCSFDSDNKQHFNKDAKIWYNKIITSIANYNLDKADQNYTSLQSEHRNSPLLKEATIILANAHIDNNEHILANYYINQYISKFALRDDIEYLEFLKIKSTFLSFKYPNREQKLIDSILKKIDKFLKLYPNSKYSILVNHMYSRVFMAQLDINLKISKLYKRIDKDKASKIYKEKLENSFIKTEIIESANTVWYKKVFNFL